MGVAEDWMSFVLYNFKVQQWSELYVSADAIYGFYVSPDLNYLYFRTVGKETKVSRLRFSDHTVETVTRLHNLHLAEGADITVAPDNSLLTTRDIGGQEIYAIKVKWP
jgi:hypothetical protein